MLGVPRLGVMPETTASQPSQQIPSSAADISSMAEAVSQLNDQPTASSSHHYVVSDDNIFHADSNQPVNTEDQNLDHENVEMLLNQKNSMIQKERSNTRASQVRQAECMIKRSRIALVAGQLVIMLLYQYLWLTEVEVTPEIF